MYQADINVSTLLSKSLKPEGMTLPQTWWSLGYYSLSLLPHCCSLIPPVMFPIKKIFLPRSHFKLLPIYYPLHILNINGTALFAWWEGTGSLRRHLQALFCLWPTSSYQFFMKLALRAATCLSNCLKMAYSFKRIQWGWLVVKRLEWQHQDGRNIYTFQI